MDNDDDFIRSLKETLTQRAGAEQEQVKKENREFDLIAAKAPEDWKKLKAWLKDKVAQLPQDLISYEEKLDSAEINYRVSQGMRTTEIVFHQKVVTQIVVQTRAGVQEGDLAFECSVERQGLRWFYATNQMASFDVPGIGRDILIRATKG